MALTFSGNGTLQAGAALSLNAARTMAISPAVTATIDTQSYAVTVAGAIGGSGGLSKVGAGALTLTASNAYTGGTYIAAGTLEFGGPSCMSAAGTVTVANGAVLAVPVGGAGGFTLSTTGSGSVGGVASGTGGQGAGVTWNLGALLGIDTANSSAIYWGSIPASGNAPSGLVKLGANTLTLSGSSAYPGPTIISGGVLQIGPPSAAIGIHFVGNGSSVTSSAGVVAISNWNNEFGYSFSGSTLANNSGQNSGAAFSLIGATNVWSTGSANQVLNGYVYVAGNSMTFTASNIPYAKYSLYAYVGDSSTGHQEMATINGTSYYYSTEGAASTYTPITSRSSSNYQSGNYIEVDGLTGSSQTVTVAGTTQTFGGLCSVEIVNTTPVVGNVNILPATSALRIAAGATLDLNAASQQIASLADQAPGSGGSVVNSVTGSTSVLTLSPSGGSTTFSGAILSGGSNGSIAVVVNGNGTQVLAGSNNTYTGGTELAGGTLAIAGDGSLGAAGGGLTFAADSAPAVRRQLRHQLQPKRFYRRGRGGDL